MRKINWFFCFILLITIITYLPLSVTVSSETLPSEMKVHYINVGQGDSIYIQTPNDKHILIDGGRPKYGKKVVSYLKKQQVKKLDLIIATHPDFDHIGGLVDVMKNFEVKQIIDSGKVHHTKAYVRYLNEVQKQDSLFNIASAKDSIKIDQDLQIKILNTHEKGKNNNQSSIVFKMIYNEMRFLFMGDLDRKHEEKLMKKFDIEADIIKIAHHGSKTSSSLEFLKEVNPKVALLTYKKRNKFGHPVDRVITNLNKIDSQIYSTAVFGDIIIYTNGKEYHIETEKDPREGILEETG